MKRLAAVLIATAALALPLTAGTASGDVHGVSQAGCGAGANAGAIASRHAIEHGRPGAPIPVTASPFESIPDFPGKGGAAPAQGTNCD
jgi:hypothetical protein